MFNKKYFYPAAALLILLGGVLRIPDLFIAYQYDELWTWQFYANRDIAFIFKDLATPNNHPLNSLLIKWSLLVSGGEPSLFFFRLPAFLAGIGAMLLALPLGIYFTRSRIGTLLVLFLLAVNPWAIVYSAQARGYSLQLFLLMLTAFCVIKSLKTSRNVWCWIAAGSVAAILSVLTLSSSVLFLLPVLGLCLLKKRTFPIWTLVIAAGGFCAFWYVLNFDQFRQGQQFGVVLDNLSALKEHFCRTPWTLCGGILLFAWLPLKKRRAWGLLLCLLFPLLAAFASRAGGARVYLPCIIPAILLGAMGVVMVIHRFRRYALLLILLAFAAGAFHYQSEYGKCRFIDWWELFAKHREIPMDTVVVYPGNFGFPAQGNNPDIGMDFSNRLIAPERLLMLIDENGINGVNRNWGEEVLAAGSGAVVDLGVCKGFLYDLALRSPSAGELVMVIGEREGLKRFADKYILLNFHFQLPEEKRNTCCAVFRFEKDDHIPDGMKTFVILP